MTVLFTLRLSRWMIKTFGSPSDPLFNVLRKLGMVVTDTAKFTHARTVQMPRREKGATTKTMNGKPTSQGAAAALARAAQGARAEPDWAALILRIRDDGDQSAFVLLFEHFAPRVKGFLMKSGADAATAEECAQDVMTTLWRKAHLFDPSRASAATWIYTIARNRRIDLLRRDRRPEPEDLTWGPEEEPRPEDVAVLKQETDLLHQALSDLPEAQADLIRRAYFGELSHGEIAAETGLPLGTIKSRIRLALDRLRHAMK